MIRTRILPAAVLLWLVAALLGPTRADARPRRVPSEVAAARQQLRSGLPMVAAEAARRCAMARPGDLRCLDVLGRSTAASGNCSEALEALDKLRRAGVWDADAAVAEGVCHAMLGDRSSARVAYEEAIALDPDEVAPRLQLAQMAARAGDLRGVERAEAALVALDAAAWQLDLVELWRAAVAGGDTLDVALWLVERSADLRLAEEAGLLVHAGLLDCELWLQLDDPMAAARSAELARTSSRNHQRLRGCLAEAVRREGDVDRALVLTSRPWDDWRDTPALDAVRARVLVDLDRLPEAESVLDELPTDWMPEVLLSRVYVAEAYGHTQEAARWRRALAALAPGEAAQADHLDPFLWSWR